MTDLYERRLEATVMASSLLRGSFDTAEVVELAEYLLHGKQTSGEETQTLGMVPVLNQTFGGEIDLDALSIRILENLDLIGDASWHEEEDEPQPGDRGAHAGDPDFGEIRVFTEEEYGALPAGTQIEYFGPYPHWEKREDGTWFAGDDTHDVWHSFELCDGDSRRVLNPEILGTFRPVERTPQPGDEDFGEIRVFDDGINSLPVGTRINHHNSAYWEMAEGGWCSPQGSVTDPTVLCGSKGRVVLNPEILGTFRPVEA